MLNYRNKWVILIHIVIILAIFSLNSTLIIEWLNRSLYVDFQIDPKLEVNASFAHGFSLVFLITLGFYFLLGNAVSTILMTDILALILILANNRKVFQRDTFVTFSELRTIASPEEILSFIHVPLWVGIIILIILLILFILLQVYVLRRIRRHFFVIHWKYRVILLTLVLILLVGIFMKPNVYNEKVLQFEPPETQNLNPLMRARKDGFIPSFIHTLELRYMDKPPGYKKKRLRAISERYQKKATQINAKRENDLNDAQTILYLSESMMDPENLPKLLRNASPIPFITQTAENNIGGTMHSPSIGGGTANIEWSILTSFSLKVFNEPLVVTPYSDFYAQSPNHESVLSMYDDEKIAIHPYSAELYNRKTIFKKLGFDEFFYVDHGIKYTKKLGTHLRISDESLTKEVLEKASEYKPSLMHVLSMQNHSPYTEEVGEMAYQPDINLDVYPKEHAQELYNYLQGIHASDQAIQTLVKKIERSDKKVNMLFYGDHLPGLFTGLEQEFGTRNLHVTPWFIYMNQARSEKGMQLEEISPAFLIPVLLKEGDYIVSPHYALMNELLEAGVKQIEKESVLTDKGEIYDRNMEKDLRELVEDYRLVQYDALFGRNWLKKDFYEVNEKR